jgi:hypothetical protein
MILLILKILLITIKIKAITDKQTQLNGILIEEIQEKSSNPLSN